MKTEKGNRKVLMDQQSGLFLLAGLILVFAGTWLTAGKLTESTELYKLYAAGIVVKHGASMWGNAREHAANAIIAAPKSNEVKPAA